MIRGLYIGLQLYICPSFGPPLARTCNNGSLRKRVLPSIKSVRNCSILTDNTVDGANLLLLTFTFLEYLIKQRFSHCQITSKLRQHLFF